MRKNQFILRLVNRRQKHYLLSYVYPRCPYLRHKRIITVYNFISEEACPNYLSKSKFSSPPVILVQDGFKAC